MATETTPSTADLRALAGLAEAVKDWSNCNQAWPHAEHYDTAVVGSIWDGEPYPLAEIDADTYGTEGESLKLAMFYAAANPGTVLALLSRIAELEAQLAAKTAPAASEDKRVAIISEPSPTAGAAGSVADTVKLPEPFITHMRNGVEYDLYTADTVRALLAQQVHSIPRGVLNAIHVASMQLIRTSDGYRLEKAMNPQANTHGITGEQP
ncbi:hypothetical protein GCM10027082_23950 [Comamonas humi]